MGDEILKTIIFVVCTITLLISSTIAKEEFSANFKSKISEYDKFFKQISEKRTGISNEQINQVKNPFVMTYSKVVVKDANSTATSKKLTYTLNATFNNKAKINGKWYNINSKIGDFKLASIRTNSVIIKNEHLKKELFIRKSNVSKIKFSSK